MRNLKFVFAVLIMSITMVSCYTSKVGVGNADVEGASVKVNSKKNHFFLAGLIHGGNKQDGSRMMSGKEDYIIKTSHTFIDLLIGFVTLHIYTPTTTSYYLPIGDVYGNVEPAKVKNKSFYSASDRYQNNYAPEASQQGREFQQVKPEKEEQLKRKVQPKKQTQSQEDYYERRRNRYVEQ